MIFPKVQNIEILNGKYALKENCGGLSLFDFYNKIKSGNSDIIIEKKPLFKPEEYSITIGEDGITIGASCDEGIYRAATSLRQLIKREGTELSFVRINDYPEISRRGYMLSITGGRKLKKEEIKKLIDFLSGLKYNEFQLYMEGECFKYSAYPEHMENYDCLDKEDIEELDRYCKDRFIDLVPNQNSFGHLELWLKNDEFKHLGLSDGKTEANTINPLLSESFEFISNLYESLLPHFESEYVNIGLDEAYGLGRYQTEQRCKEIGKDAVFMEWLNKLNDLISKKYGKKVMFWGDMIYKFEKLFKLIPKDAIVLEWGYELIQSQLMTEHCIMFKNAGLDYYVCPSSNTHSSYTGRADVTSFNIRTCAELAVKYGAKGMLLTEWGGDGTFCVWGYVPAALCGQYGWNTGVEQDGETFKADFIRASEKYVDEEIFGGVSVSRLLYRISNYYLLEPERVHVGTICAELFPLPLDQSKFAYFYDLKDFGDAFYFDNVVEYINKVLADVEKLDFDARLKREIILNSQMVILASELCKIRIGYNPDNAEIDKLISLSDWILEEYRELFLFRNYAHGIEIYENYLKSRRNELVSLKK